MLVFVGFISCIQMEIKPPNIVVVMADDMGYECIGANGNTEYQTRSIYSLNALLVWKIS